jgi:hypothetical protein
VVGSEKSVVTLTEIEISLPSEFSVSRCEQAIEAVAAEHSLLATLKDTLKQYSGCIHWHFKYGKERGVLEITLWPQEQRAWISIHTNRHADWIEKLIPPLKEKIEQSL